MHQANGVHDPVAATILQSRSYDSVISGEESELEGKIISPKPRGLHILPPLARNTASLYVFLYIR